MPARRFGQSEQIRYCPGIRCSTTNTAVPSISLRLPVALTAGEDVDLAAPMTRHLDGDMGRAPEAVEAQPLAELDITQPQRPVADDPGAEKRRGLHVGEALPSGG